MGLHFPTFRQTQIIVFVMYTIFPIEIRIKCLVFHPQVIWKISMIFPRYPPCFGALNPPLEAGFWTQLCGATGPAGQTKSPVGMVGRVNPAFDMDLKMWYYSRIGKIIIKHWVYGCIIFRQKMTGITRMFFVGSDLSTCLGQPYDMPISIYIYIVFCIYVCVYID